MRQSIVISLLSVVLLGSCGSVTAAESAGLRKISDHVYAYVDAKGASPETGFGANAGVVVGSDAALVVDTLLSPKMAEKFMADIRKVTDKPVKYVVNTHYHLDHAWGNQVFVKAGAVVIAQSNSRQDAAKARETLAHPDGFGLTAKDVEGIVFTPATILFPEKLTVDLGGVTVELNYYGPTHTDDSIIVLVAEDRVVFAGDMLFAHYHPYLAEGNIEGWVNGLDKLIGMDLEKIVPGHGPLAKSSDLVDMKKYLQTFDKEARVLCAGKKAEDAPAIAAELAKRLPEQGRTELQGMIEGNLRVKYLPQPSATNKEGEKIKTKSEK